MHYAPPMARPPIPRVMATGRAMMRGMAQLGPGVATDGCNSGFDAERDADRLGFDVTRRPIPSQLKIGDTTYPLRSPLIGTFHPGRGGAEGEFIVPELYPDFIGRGKHLNAAFLDWRNQIHSSFQSLHAKRPFEMTASERETWRLLEGHIDVAAYRLAAPLVVRQIGKVAQARPYPNLIQWENGPREAVRLDQMPGAFATYRPGQPFEAIVERDPTDFHLLKVSYIQRAKSPPRMSPEEISDLLNIISTTSSLPDADWD